MSNNIKTEISVKVIKKDSRKPSEETLRRQEESLLKLLMRKNPEKTRKFYQELGLGVV